MPKKSTKSKAKSKGENTTLSTKGSSNPAGPPSGTPQSTSDKAVEEAKSEGNALFQQKKWLEARDAYMKGASLPTSDPNLRKALLLNLAATNLQLGSWADVLHDTTTVLAMDSNSVKALYRSARALNELKRFEEALDFCERGLKLEPLNQPLKEVKYAARNGAIRTQQILLIKAYAYHHLHIVPTSKTNEFMSIPTTHPHELPYFDPPTPSDPQEAPHHSYVRFRYIERHASDTVSDYPMDMAILPLLNTFLPGSTKFVTPSRSRNNLTFVPSGDDPNITHPTSWDPLHEFLPSTLLVYARTGRGDTILVRGEMTLADVFGQVRQLSAAYPDDEDTYLELKRGMIHLFAFRKDSETERRWNDGYFKDPAELGDPHLRSRHFSYDNTEARARGTNFVTSLSWAAREGILQLLYMRSEEDESSSGSEY
ncbi:40S ribosomal protein [Ceratobasidium sp. 370]|nr:40S ribosomal protein [Ceratobasidium sp. 370]